MKRRLILSTILSAAAALTLAASVQAAGLNLSWDDCGASGILTRTSACANNASAGTMYGTCQLPVDMHQLNGQTGVVDVQINAVNLSPWWDMRSSGGCAGRTGAVTGDMNFLSNPNCNDPWQGNASPGSNTAFRQGGASNQVRLKATGAISGISDADAVTEWAMWKITISGAKTVGTGACTGCTDAACLVYNDQFVTQPIGVGDFHITNELDRRYILWQSAFTSGGDACPVFVPTKSQTWGRVKSLYR